MPVKAYNSGTSFGGLAPLPTLQNQEFCTSIRHQRNQRFARCIFQSRNEKGLFESAKRERREKLVQAGRLNRVSKSPTMRICCRLRVTRESGANFDHEIKHFCDCIRPRHEMLKFGDRTRGEKAISRGHALFKSPISMSPPRPSRPFESGGKRLISTPSWGNATDGGLRPRTRSAITELKLR